MKFGTKVKFSKKVIKNKDGLEFEFEDKEDAEKQINGFAVMEREYFYTIRKTEKIQETKGIIFGIRSLGFVRKIRYFFCDGNAQSPDEIAREGTCGERKKCYLVATNMKTLVYVLCEDVEEVL